MKKRIITLLVCLLTLAVSLCLFTGCEKGEKGDVGEKGEKGDIGEKGEAGTNGKSAYELAVENGFEGTEIEWLESLSASSLSTHPLFQDMIEGAYIGTTSGKIVANSAYKYISVSVIPGMKIVYDYKGAKNSVFGLAFYDECGSVISTVASTNTDVIVVPENTIEMKATVSSVTDINFLADLTTFYSHKYKPLNEKISAFELPNTVVYENSRLGIASDNAIQISTGLFKVLRIDLNDLAEFEPQELATETEYTGGASAVYCYRAVLTNEDGRALKNIYGNGYTGMMSFNASELKATSPTARYIYVSMEIGYEVGLFVQGSAELPKWTGVPQLKEQVNSMASVQAPIIVFPRKVVAVIGHEFNMYYRNVVQCNNVDDYIIYCSISPNPSSIFNKNNTNMLSDCFRITPPEGSEGTYTLRLRLLDKVTGKTVAEKTTELHVIADTAVTGKKVMFIGDSLTDAGIYPAEIQHNLSNGGIISIGTRSDTVTIDGVSLTVNHEGRAGWASYDYTRSVPNYRTDVDNPFWNEKSGAFDFSYYMTQQGYESVDVVCINLGTNGVNSDKTIPAIDEIIKSIHAYDSNIKIIVSLITQGATQSGFGINVGIMSGSKFDYDAITLVKQYIAKYDGVNANVDVSELYFCLDKLNDFDTRTEAVSARNPNTRVVQTNNVHPNKYGYLKFADVYYNNILYHLSK